MRKSQKTKKSVAKRIAQNYPKKSKAAFLMCSIDGVEARMTQEEIARASGVSRKTLYNWQTNDEEFIKMCQEITRKERLRYGPLIRKRFIEETIRHADARRVRLYAEWIEGWNPNKSESIKSKNILTTAEIEVNQVLE